MDYIEDINNTIKPNYMQRKALKELRRYRDMGVNKALIVSATGSGKTYLAAFDSREFNRVLFVAHREEILKQAYESFKNVRLDKFEKHEDVVTKVAESVITEKENYSVGTKDLDVVTKLNSAISVKTYSVSLKLLD